MRITCPACDAAYDVPDVRIAVGRTVRCARCGSDWVPLADTAPPPPQLLPVPDPGLPAAAPSQPVPAASAAAVAIPAATTAAFPEAAMLPATTFAPQSPPAPARARSPAVPVLLAWAGSLALLGLLVWAGIAWRAGIMHAWPPSERLYAALGLLRGPPAR